MKGKIIGFGGLALLIVGLVWLRGTYFSDEAKIRRTLRALASDISFSTNTGNFSKITKLNRLLGRLTDDAMISVEQVVSRLPPVSGRSDLQLMAQAVFSLLSSCEVTLHDIAVEAIGNGVNEARVALTASATTGRAGDVFAGQEFNVTLRKSKEGQWLVAKIEAVRTLRP